MINTPAAYDADRNRQASIRVISTFNLESLIVVGGDLALLAIAFERRIVFRPGRGRPAGMSRVSISATC